MPTAAYDLRYLQAGFDQLESYLLSHDLYRPIGIQAAPGETPYPQFTLGWLLLARLRVQVTSQSAAERFELECLSAQIDALHSRWRSAWGNKAQAEFRARLNLWRDFLEEYREHPASNYDRYAYEVSRRVLLELLAPEVAQLPEADRQALFGLDHWLLAVFAPGAFIWDPILAPGFPQPKYWYLFGKLPDILENRPSPTLK
jgi:hypothetical protein